MPIGCRNCYYLNQFILCIITFRSLRFFSAIVLCKTFFFQPLHYAKCLPFAFSSSKFSNIIVYVHCIHNNYTMTIFTPSLNLSPSLMSTLLPPTYHFLLSSFFSTLSFSLPLHLSPMLHSLLPLLSFIFHFFPFPFFLLHHNLPLLLPSATPPPPPSPPSSSFPQCPTSTQGRYFFSFFYCFFLLPAGWLLVC